MYFYFCLWLVLGILQIHGDTAARKEPEDIIQGAIDAILKETVIRYQGVAAAQLPSIQSIKLLANQVKIKQQDLPFVEKRYSIVNTALNHEEAICGVHSDHMEVMTTDEQLVQCLETLDRNTNLTIHGTWIIHGNQIGKICATSSFGLKLPKPGGVVSIRDCQYEPIQFLGIQLSMRDRVVTETLEAYRQGSTSCSVVYEDDKRGCDSVIEWGDDVPRRHCRPPEADSLVRVPFTIFEWSSGKDDPEDRTNLKLDITPVRTLMEAKGFNFSPGAIPPYWTTGIIDSVNIQMVCSVSGLKQG